MHAKPHCHDYVTTASLNRVLVPLIGYLFLHFSCFSHPFFTSFNSVVRKALLTHLIEIKYVVNVVVLALFLSKNTVTKSVHFASLIFFIIIKKCGTLHLSFSLKMLFQIVYTSHFLLGNETWYSLYPPSLSLALKMLSQRVYASHFFPFDRAQI